MNIGILRAYIASGEMFRQRSSLQFQHINNPHNAMLEMVATLYVLLFQYVILIYVCYVILILLFSISMHLARNMYLVDLEILVPTSLLRSYCTCQYDAIGLSGIPLMYFEFDDTDVNALKFSIHTYILSKASKWGEIILERKTHFPTKLPLG